MPRTIRLPADNKGLDALTFIIDQSLKGKAVSRARQSIGSVLLLDFGELFNSSQGKRKRKFGEWHLFVNMADWRISEDGKDILSSKDDTRKISVKIGKLEGGVVKELVIRRCGNMRLSFENGMIIAIKKVYRRNNNHNWTIFYRDIWSFGNADSADQFTFERYG